MRQIIAKINDSSELWTKVMEYIISRLSLRYDTMDELKDDANTRYKEAMIEIQANYTRWFKNELIKNPSLYGVEILGGEKFINDLDDTDVINEKNKKGDENIKDLDDVFKEEQKNIQFNVQTITR